MINMRRIISTIALAAAVVLGGVFVHAQRPLEIYYIDVEGGGATLFVSPSGESLLVDAGNPGARDVQRILAVLSDAGIKQIDYFLATHYHSDHVGGTKDSKDYGPRR
jgi:beta-lactamase superfamily II metal-dependent hydrolase